MNGTDHPEFMDSTDSDPAWGWILPIKGVLFLWFSHLRMSLTANPASCTVPAAGGTSTHQLINAGAEKLVFKVKSSNNNEYRIKPVFGFVDAGAATPLEITRLAGAAKDDRLLVLFAPAPADATDAAAAFKGIAVPAGYIRIIMTATA